MRCLVGDDANIFVKITCAPLRAKFDAAGLLSAQASPEIIPYIEMDNDTTHGFNVPATDAGANKWFKWCYEIIAEAAPELFEVEVAAAYNDLLEACAKYPELEAEACLCLAKTTEEEIHTRFPVFMAVGDYKFAICAKNSLPLTDVSERYHTAREEISPKCKALYDIIVPKIIPYLVKMRAIEYRKSRIRLAEEAMDAAEEFRKKETQRLAEIGRECWHHLCHERNEYEKLLATPLAKYEDVSECY